MISSWEVKEQRTPCWQEEMEATGQLKPYLKCTVQVVDLSPYVEKKVQHNMRRNALRKR